MGRTRKNEILRIALFLLATVATVAWIAAYLYIGALGCAFVTSSRGCSIDMPWELRGEDFMIFVLIPGVIVAAFWALAIWVARRPRS